jgi:hypothetical protein
MNDNSILDLINLINDINDKFNFEFFSETGEMAENYFGDGRCIYLAELLKRFFPDGKIVLYLKKQHALFELFDMYFDILGPHGKEEFPDCVYLDDSPCSEISFYHTGYSHKEAENIINSLEAKIKNNEPLEDSAGGFGK